MNDSELDSDDFDIQMQRLGYKESTFSYQPIIGDARIIGQQEVNKENALSGGFFVRFGENRFRKVLRHLLEHRRCSWEALKKLNIAKQTLDEYLAYLLKTNIVLQEGSDYSISPIFHNIKDIGATLEWYVATWFRLALKAPARHGVHLDGMPEGGDLDVVGFVREKPILVECKSGNPKNIDEEQLHLFLQRVALFKPTIGLLLVDTESRIDDLLEKLQRVYATSSIVGPENTKGIYLDVECVHVCNAKKSLIDSLYATLESHASGDEIDRPLLTLTSPTISRITGILPGLTENDSRVVRLACEQAIEQNTSWVHVEPLLALVTSSGMTQEDFYETVEIVERTGYVEQSAPGIMKLSVYGFDQYARVYIPEYTSVLQKVAALIISGDPLPDSNDLACSMNQQPRVTEHVLEYLAWRGYFKLAQFFGGGRKINNISSALKRAVKEGKEL